MGLYDFRGVPGLYPNFVYVIRENAMRRIAECAQIKYAIIGFLLVKLILSST